MQPLIQDALNNVWSVPDPFNQVIVEPARITKDGGAIKAVRVGWDTVALPGIGAWHVYQVGQIHPLMINLFANDGEWELVSDSCNYERVTVNLYNSLGFEFPRTRTYFMRAPDKNLIFAVEINPVLGINFDTSDFFIRIYRNVYFQTQQSAVFNIGGGHMLSTNTISALQSEIETIRTGPNYRGGLICFVNGIKREAINIITTRPGDIAEYVYDSSIYKVVDFPITSLQSFTSTLDNKSKWLLHYDSGWDGSIDHCADIDAYLVDNVANIGCYVHKNAEDTLRMVTFKDYAIVASYIRAYYENFYSPQTGSLALGNLSIRLHIRYSGSSAIPKGDCYKTPYILRLPLNKQLGSMVGAEAGLDVWQAATLEASAYNQLMLHDRSNISTSLVEQAYGYSAINATFGKNIVEVQTSGPLKFANVPLGFQSGATAYEYDINGKLLGNYPVASTVVSYTCQNVTAAHVEFIQGTATNSLDEQIANMRLTFTPGYNYRFYDKGTHPNSVGHPILNATYTDVTNVSGHYELDANNNVVWVPVRYKSGGGALNPSYTTQVLGFVLSDKKHFYHQVSLNPSDGVLYYVIQIKVELGEFDFWLNGYPLVEGIDYLFSWPAVNIISKRYLATAGQANVLSIRGHGFCTSSGASRRRAETGFVFDGALSVNNDYDLHENKSLRVVSNGALIASSKHAFVELVSSGTLENGAPYEIRQITNPLSGIIASDPYVLSDADYAIEQRVSDYLSLRIPEVTSAPINPIVDKYKLYSPFLSKIMYAMLSGSIGSGSYATQYSDNDVRQAVQPYAYLLATDPIKEGNTPDLEYCVIHPHWLNTSVTLSADQFRFLSNVTRLYAGNKVILTPLVVIG